MIRKMITSDGRELNIAFEEKLAEAIEKLKINVKFSEKMSEPWPQLFEKIKDSMDWVTPVAAGCFQKGKWYFGTNKIDLSIPKFDIENRTELFHNTNEHAEINLLKQLGEVEVFNVPIYVTLFPCDRCMKVLNNKGVKEIYYLEDHPDKNWSKRSHALAEKYEIKTINISNELDVSLEKNIPEEFVENSYKFIDPNNVRYQEQLDIMLEMEKNGKDPLDPEFINQEILFKTDFWYVSLNRFSYDEVEKQFLITSLLPIYKQEEMSEEMWIDLKNIWEKLISEYNISGGALCFRFGETLLSGASLKRLHCHFIMPKKGYKTKFNIGGSNNPKKVLK